MYRINQVRLPICFDKTKLCEYLGVKFKVDKSNFKNCKLVKLSIDARDKSDLHYKAGIIFDVSNKNIINRLKGVEKYIEEDLTVSKWRGDNKKIVVVGSGPSGLFAGIRLAESGANVTIIEQGYEMSKRQNAVSELMEKGILDTRSNIQFGEGGAGTFSDGKLNTGIKTKYIKLVLDTFHKFGADENILYDAKPHIGTDVLSKVIVNMRKYFESLGGEIFFETKLVDFEECNGEVRKVIVERNNRIETIDCNTLILAIGHSSRDTIRMLHRKHIEFKQKPFSLGFRVEHLQEEVNVSQYGNSDIAKLLPPADYHIAEHIEDRVVYSFCMCPGGVVVPAMSEEGTIVTNGMSYHSRSGRNSNSALLVSVNTSDFPSEDVLSGIELQEEIETNAYKVSGSYKAIVQKVGDFLESKPTKELGQVIPSYKPGYILGSVETLLPEFVITSLKKGIPIIARKFKFFCNKDAIFTGVETRSSAPYQVIRDTSMQTSIKGIYSIGEGAGFAGGIVSSAVEGLKCADIIIENNI